MKKMLFAFALGAAVAYLFDPQSGTRRRNGLQRKFGRSGASTEPKVDAVDVLVFDERTPIAAGMS